MAYELAGDLLTPDRSIQQAVLLLGEGANGKGTYLRLLVTFLGPANTAALSLHRLEADKFAKARLLGRLANSAPDLPSTHLDSTSTFKELTGTEGLINAEFKYRDSFEFECCARLIFSANHPPRSGDASHAFFRRWLVIPFTRTFAPEVATPRAQLDAALSTPDELSGLLNRALVALRAVRARGSFSQSPSMQAAWSEFRESTDPLAVWLERK